MNNKIMISLCMPTNGVSEWVFPVLDSIYNQRVDENLFEVVITDNGDNATFKAKMKEYLVNHSNIVYAETKALPFLNEIEAYKRASGQLIKFVNHRTLLVQGALQKLIDFVYNNLSEKPIVYFSNGVLSIPRKENVYESFDEFVKNLSYYSSWSTGMTIWKEDFEKLPTKVEEYNEMFPHTTVLFSERSRGKYVIDNTIIMDELPTGSIPKARYDLFQTFGVEYPGIIFELVRVGDISNKTFRCVVNRNLYFIATLYRDFCLLKQPCSYDLNGLSKIFGVFYIKPQFYVRVMLSLFSKVKNKIIKRK